MIIQVGKHKGKSVETMTLKHPEYVIWMGKQRFTGHLLTVYREIEQLIDIFDNKKFVKNCVGRDCVKTAKKVIPIEFIKRNSL